MAAGAEQFASERATLKRGVDSIAHQSAVVAAAYVAAVDSDATAHVDERDVCRTIATHHTTGILAGGVDDACRLQVLDGAAIGVEERCSILLCGGVVDSNRMAVAVEGASECKGCGDSRHCCHLDVIGQLQELAVEAGDST